MEDQRICRDAAVLKVEAATTAEDDGDPGRSGVSLVIAKNQHDREVVIDVSELCALQALAAGEPELWERFGRLVDRLDNAISGMALPVSPTIHLEGLKGLLPEIRAELHAAYVAATGEDPWED